MLDIVRNLVSSIFGKILLAIMVLSFALWGVGDILSSGNSQLAAKIGNEKITLDEFYFKFQNLVKNYNQANNSNINMKEAYKMSLHNLLLNDLVFSKMINDYSKNKKMLINDDALKKIILDLPQFQNNDGNFSKNKYKNYIFNNFESEEEFLKEIENTIYQGLLFEIYDVNNFMNEKIVELIYNYEGEKRKIGYFIINKEQIEVNHNQDLLKKYYEENKNDYLTEESVIIDYIKINLEDFKEINFIKDDQTFDYYNSNLNLYVKPETRDVQIFRFTNIEKSKNFFNDTKNLSESDFDNYILSNEINSNTINRFKGETFTDSITENIFSLDLNALSKTVEFKDVGYFNFKVKKINPEEIQSYSSVKEEIRNYLALEAAYFDYDEAINLADEMLINDYSFNEISENIQNSNIFKSINSLEFDKLLGEKLNYNNPVGYISDVIIKNNSAYIYTISTKKDSFISKYEDVVDEVLYDYELKEKGAKAISIANQVLIEFQFKDLVTFKNFARNNNYDYSTIEIERKNNQFKDETNVNIFNLEENNLMILKLSDGEIGVGFILDIIDADNSISNSLFSSVINNVNFSYNKSIESIIGNEIINNSNYEIYYNNIDKLFM